MIRLYQFAPALGLPNASPFCMKLETWLRMSGLSHECVTGDLRKAPKGKMPWIEDGGEVIADSGFAIEHLERKYRVGLDAWLTPVEAATALAFRRLIEENLYWAVVHTRWIEPAGFALSKQAFFGRFPAPLRWIVPPLARRGIARELHGHGMGRHRAQEIHAIGRQDITALADFLGEKKWFMGNAPCSLDATAFAFLANLLWAPLEGPLQAHARSYPHLDAYCRRMMARYYPQTAGA